jgi:hypothetical protein
VSQMVERGEKGAIHALVWAIVILGFFLVLIGGLALLENQAQKSFIKLYAEKPYCLQDSSEVLGKTVTLKRCWKVIEVEP